eukprot:5699529-Alexandrium_andersonii.AAC.1
MLGLPQQLRAQTDVSPFGRGGVLLGRATGSWRAGLTRCPRRTWGDLAQQSATRRSGRSGGR